VTSWLRRLRAAWWHVVGHRVPGWPAVRFRGAPPLVEGRRLKPVELGALLEDLEYRTRVRLGDHAADDLRASLAAGVLIEWLPADWRVEIPDGHLWLKGQWRRPTPEVV